MSSFEELHARWVDGGLAPDAAAAVEAECRARGELGREAAGRLGALLREHGAAPALRDGDRLNARVLEGIALAEEAEFAPFGGWLRERAGAPAMGDPDRLNRAVMEGIAAEEERAFAPLGALLRARGAAPELRDAAALNAAVREGIEQSEAREGAALGALLREHADAPPLRNAEFLNLKVREGIGAKLPAPDRPAAPAWAGWIPWRLFAGGLACLLAAMLAGKSWLPTGRDSVPRVEPWVAGITSVTPGDGVEVYALQPKPGEPAVLWLEGLDPMQPENGRVWSDGWMEEPDAVEAMP